jgi:chemotaxis protein methyltransferase CheR
MGKIPDSCDAFLEWVLHSLDMRPAGFKKVRKQVCKRIKKRRMDLNLNSYEEYRSFLQKNPREWWVVDQMTRITISRFFRDGKTWEKLGDMLLPEIILKANARGHTPACWSAGCASGEEPYSFAILWMEKILPSFPDTPLELIATDADEHLLKRASLACYERSSLKEVPPEWINKAFCRKNSSWCLKGSYRKLVKFDRQDIRGEMPQGLFDLVFCKNLAAMYFKKELAATIFRKISERMRQGAFLMLGSHEEFPLDQVKEIKEYDRGLKIYQKE